MKRSLRRGMTLLDLLVAIALIIFLSAAMLPAQNRNRETANRVRCGSNLRQIGQALMLYANENNGNYPRTKYDPKSDKINAYTGYDSKNPFEKDGGPEVNDVTTPLYLLLRTQDLVPGVFVCPSTEKRGIDFGIKAKAKDGGPSTRPAARPATQSSYQEPDPAIVAAIQVHSNFPDNRSLDYSIHNPYFSEKAIDAGSRWTNTLKADFALAGDMNPGSPELLKLNATAGWRELQAANSANHQRVGQNILYGDLHVEFLQTPFAGVEQENIYTYGASGKDNGGEGIIGSTTGANDSVLLPTVEQGKAKEGGEGQK